jgi:hypothetical protein
MQGGGRGSLEGLSRVCQGSVIRGGVSEVQGNGFDAFRFFTTIQ